MLRWIFLRGGNAVTCEIRANNTHSYDVCVIPHRSLSAAVVERYERTADAVRRHAEVARCFRDAGWMLVRAVSRAATG
jgi:hypothetical protein